MNVYPINSAVLIRIPFADLNGDPVTPVLLSYQLFDEDGAELVGPTNVTFAGGDTDTAIVIPGNLNGFVGPRTLELTINTISAVIIVQEIFAIVPSQRLEFLKNTFQTLAQALYLARDMPNISGFLAATADQQQTGMIAAWDRLTKLNYVIPFPEMVDFQSVLSREYYAGINPRMWPLMTETLFAVYPEIFHIALRKAQIAEANDILTGDPIADKIASGLFSWKVGESSMMFRSGVGPMKFAVSRAALKYLQGFTNNRVVTTRS